MTENNTFDQLISTLIISPSDDILSGISNFLIEAQMNDLNIFISKSFQSLLTLEHWAWEILSRDSRQWQDDEQQQYLQLFSNLSSFNTKLILSENDIKTKESLILPLNIDIINGVFGQISKRQDEKDQFISVINLWFDILSLLIHEHIQFTSVPVIIHINERIISDFIMDKQFKIHLNQLLNSSLTLTVKQLFYLKTCVFSLAGYLSSQPEEFPYSGEQIIEHVACDYTNIILIHSETISLWSKELRACITHLIGLITACSWWIGIDDEILKMFIIPTKTISNYLESLIDIISYRRFHDQITSQYPNTESMLVTNILGSFKYLVNFPNIIYFLRFQKKLIDTFLIFNHINNDRIYFLTYHLQSEILSEKQIKQLNIAKNINENFFYYLQQAWKNPLKIYNKIPIEELLAGLLNLSKNDVVKNSIANSTQLSFLIELSDIYLIMYDILWSLSFDIRIREHLRLNRTFINQLENTSTNEQIHGLQWNLNSDNIQISNNNNTKEKYDILISYSHHDEIISTQIYNELIKNEYHVWIDFNEIHENIMDGMAEGVERSRIIIICMSEEYKRSNYCRAEAQYAFKRRLKIIPILVQQYYKPDGWLAFVIGNLPCIDLIKNEFSIAIEMLLNQLKTPCISVIDSLVIRQQPENVTNLSLPPLRSKDMRQWTQNDVQQWLTEHNLSQMTQLLSDLNGSTLIYLSQLISNNSPQENFRLFQEESLKRTGRNISLIEIAKLYNLIEQQIRSPIQAKRCHSIMCCRMM